MRLRPNEEKRLQGEQMGSLFPGVHRVNIEVPTRIGDGCSSIRGASSPCWTYKPNVWHRVDPSDGNTGQMAGLLLCVFTKFGVANTALLRPHNAEACSAERPPWNDGGCCRRGDAKANLQVWP